MSVNGPLASLSVTTGIASRQGSEYTGWRNQMETFPRYWPCAENSPVTGEFPSQRPVTRSFDVFFDLRLNQVIETPLIWDAIAFVDYDVTVLIWWMHLFHHGQSIYIWIEFKIRLELIIQKQPDG